LRAEADLHEAIRSAVASVRAARQGYTLIVEEFDPSLPPVLGNADLRCGLQYITPETGRTATADGFAEALADMLRTRDVISPREAVMRQWSWPHSVARLGRLVASARQRRKRGRAPV